MCSTESRRAVNVALCVEDDTAVWTVSILPVEAEQHRLFPSVSTGREFVHGPRRVGAAIECCAVEISQAIQSQSGIGSSTIRSSAKGIENRHGLS